MLGARALAMDVILYVQGYTILTGLERWQGLLEVLNWWKKLENNFETLGLGFFQ